MKPRFPKWIAQREENDYPASKLCLETLRMLDRDGAEESPELDLLASGYMIVDDYDDSGFIEMTFASPKFEKIGWLVFNNGKITGKAKTRADYYNKLHRFPCNSLQEIETFLSWCLKSEEFWTK